MHSKRLILRHLLLSLSFLLLYLLLNRPEVILISRLGVVVWYPASGLVLALMLGVSPWYALLVGLAGALAGSLIYHQPLASFGETVGSAGAALCYGAAAYILRGPLRIDLALRHRRDVVRYVFVTMIAAAAATGIGVACLAADHSIPWSAFWSSTAIWFFGDGIGLLGFAPFLLIHVFPWVRRHISTEADEPVREAVSSKAILANLGAVAEAMGQAAALVLVLWIMLGPSFGSRQLFYLAVVPIIWIAMRHGIRRVVTGLVVFNFGVIAAMRIFQSGPHPLDKIELLMLMVSAAGLLVGSAVSERHRIAIALQEQSTYLKSLIEHSPFGIVVLDRQGRVELTNTAFQKLFLYAQDELTGRNLDLILSPKDKLAESLQVLPQVLAGQALDTTVRRQRKDGKFLDLAMHAVPLVVGGRIRGAYAIYEDVSERIKAAAAERKHAESLSRLVKELQLRTDQMTLLNEMGDLLDCCSTIKEACQVVSRSVQKLFPEALSGSLYLFKSSRNVLEATVRWGDASASEPLFPPEACWALRRGYGHWSGPAGVGISCSHLSQNSTANCLCMPMIGQEEALGVLHLEFASEAEARTDLSPENLQESQQRLAATVAGQVAFSLTSLRLRETLRDQSIRDPLTGLFNRRFMEESLSRELQRAARKGNCVSVLFLDLDHFKRFNDAFGHDAGDLVLRSIADVFLRFFRADDVCCRFGGEEFTIILPESSADYAAIRANALREEVKKLKLRYKEHALNTVTLSIGIAAFPEHGSTSDELLKMADRCLYESKAAGRDAVTVATHQHV